ncbi:hypothetical protein [Petroclostridium sp. X23]|uniref:hypothetical protein n=1 Tax=Petroclostridium sp. X23 TaxID=3045146 RepID=UPI0024AD57DB|nr:hypothetical protein [Petroclostridium sp. X23]WHH57522.1 hypothetical protein QKW49_17020 [Petroclostridium sp. X23]
MRRRALLISLAIIVLLGAVGVFVLNNAFSLLLTQEFSISNATDEQSDQKKQQAEDMVQSDKQVEVNTVDTDEAVDKNIEESKQTPDVKQEAENKPVIKSPSQSADKQTDVSSEKGPQQSKPTQIKENTPSVQPAQKPLPVEKVVVDETKMKEIEKKVSFTDKSKALSIVLGSLTKEDYKRLLEMSKDGVTQQEKREAKEILSKRLTEEKKQQLKELYDKYDELLLQ